MGYKEMKDLIERRRSARSGGPLLAGALIDVLHLAWLNPPSAGGFRTIKPYVAVGEVRDIEPGVYLYNGDLKKEQGIEVADSYLSHAAGAMSAARTPPAVILLRPEWSNLKEKYGANAFALATREAGVWLGILSLVSIASGVGGCCLGPKAWGKDDLAAFALWGQTEERKQ